MFTYIILYIFILAKHQIGIKYVSRIRLVSWIYLWTSAAGSFSDKQFSSRPNYKCILVHFRYFWYVLVQVSPFRKIHHIPNSCSELHGELFWNDHLKWISNTGLSGLESRLWTIEIDSEKWYEPYGMCLVVWLN